VIVTLRRHRDRRAELGALRRRLRDAAREPAGDDERALARRLRQLRRDLAAALGAVASCGGCAARLVAGVGKAGWSGGFCCSGNTEDVFADHEVAALALAGVNPRHLRPPSSERAGCLFRGPTGCSLDPAHRPNVCARYICRELAAELGARGDAKKIFAIVEAIEVAYLELAERRAARRENEWLAEIAGLIETSS
jgi:hypothetical protein